MRKGTFILGTLLAGLCAPAAAFHPLMCEDTGFLGKDVKQVEVGFDHSISREGADIHANTITGEISYGLFDTVDLLMSAPWQGWSSHGLAENGPGDVSIEAKFKAAERNGWVLALRPGFSLPAGDEAKSLGAGKGGAWLTAIAGAASGPWQYYLDAGYALNRNDIGERESILKGAAAGTYALAPGLLAAGDISIETNPEKGSASHPVSAVLGLIWSPYPTLDLDAGVKLGLTRPADDLGILAGFTLRL